jgi:hypothetical protein
LTASHRLIVIDDGENWYGVAPTCIVVVGPLVAQAVARVAVCFGVDRGLGLDVVVAAGAVVRAEVDAVGFAVATGCVALGAGEDGVAVGVGESVAAMGGDCVSCTRTLPDPLLHAAAATISARAAATLPEVRMTA